MTGGKARDRGIAVGEAAAATMLAARQDDGRFGPFRFPVGTEPGEWRPDLPAFVNDPAAWVADVRPFLIKSPSQFRSDGPNPLEQQALRARVRRGQVAGVDGLDQIARRTRPTWPVSGPNTRRRCGAGSSGSSRPVKTCRSADSSRFYAMLYLTAADAAISLLGRQGALAPLAADQRHPRGRAPTANPATSADPDWVPLIATPPYPEHPVWTSAA